MKQKITDGMGLCAASPFFAIGWLLKRLWLALKFIAGAFMTGIES